MFSRFLGQSLGAAVFGAVTNFVLLRRLDSAPASLHGTVPSSIDQVSGALTGHPSPAVEAFLRASLHASTHAVFLALLASGIATLVILLVVVPRHFPTLGNTAEHPDHAAQQPDGAD
jgi:hypothetical protein